MCTDFLPALADTPKAQVSEGTVCITASVISGCWCYQWLLVKLLCIIESRSYNSVHFNSHYNRPLNTRWGVEVYLYSFFSLSAKWKWVVNATPRPLYPRERPGTHCIGGRSGRVRLISPPPVFEPLTVQPVKES
jgi:hypothetical protein